jgi:hypothetical protein
MSVGDEKNRTKRNEQANIDYSLRESFVGARIGARSMLVREQLIDRYEASHFWPAVRKRRPTNDLTSSRKAALGRKRPPA